MDNPSQEDDTAPRKQHRCSIYIPYEFYVEFMEPLEGKVNWSQIARTSFKQEALRLRGADVCLPAPVEDAHAASTPDACIHAKLDKLIQAVEALSAPAVAVAERPSAANKESVDIIGKLVGDTITTKIGIFTLKNSKGAKFPAMLCAPFEGKKVKVSGTVAGDGSMHVQNIQLHVPPPPNIDISKIPPPPPF